MIKEIECVGYILEDFIKYGEQIPAYRFFQGGIPENFKKKTRDYYNKGKEFSEIFDKGEDFLESLKVHTENCKGCLKTMEELKEKYQNITEEKLSELSEQSKSNLRYFGLLS